MTLDDEYQVALHDLSQSADRVMVLGIRLGKSYKEIFKALMKKVMGASEDHSDELQP